MLKEYFFRENWKKDKKILGLIQQGLDDVIFLEVSIVESSNKV